MDSTRAEALDTFWERVNERRLDEAVSLYHPAAEINLAGRKASGRSEIKSELQGFISAFHDIRYSVAARWDAGEVVIEEWTARGTHTGPFMGRAPTGASIRLHAATIYEFAGSEVVRDRTYLDMAPTLLRTGVLTQPSEGGEGGS